MGRAVSLVAMAMIGHAWASRADAQPPTNARIELSYEVPTGCPSRSEFLELVRARDPVSRRAGDGEAERHMGVLVRNAPPGYTGRLTSYDRDHALLVREVTAATCSEVTDALAFIAAVAMDTAAGSTTLEAPAAPMLHPEEPAPEPTPTSNTAISQPTNYAGAVGAHTEIVSAMAPGPVIGFPMFLDVAIRRESTFAPSFRFAFVPTLTVTRTNDVGSAHFRWMMGRLEICPLQLVLSRSMRALPCSRVDAGLVSAAGELVGESNALSRPWAAVGATVRFGWTFAAPLTLELEAGAVVPLTRDKFFFQPNTEIYRFRSAGALGSLGLALRFW